MAVNIAGTFGYTTFPGTNQIELRIDRIENNQFGYTTGTLRLELWATQSPYTGGTIDGYRLATDNLSWIDGDGRLSPGEYYHGIRHTVAWDVKPPEGFWNLTMVVGEYTGDIRNNGFSIGDAEAFTGYFVYRSSGSTRPSSASDWLAGTTSGDVLSGLEGDDWFYAGAGNDYINGGGGLDTAMFGGVRGNFTVRSDQASGSFTVTGREGNDTLVDIERLHFHDGTLALDLSGNAGKAYRLYQAAFGRTPETAGIAYQTHDLDTKYTLVDVASNFLASPEFQFRYGAPGTVDDARFITLLYENVLHRAPEASGMAYHMNSLSNGAGRSGLLIHFSESPENQANVYPAIKEGIWLG